MNALIRSGSARRLCIAPDRFDDTLPAPDAAAAMARGVARIAEELDIKLRVDLCPISDGGPGTLDALAGATSLKTEEIEVEGPTDEPVIARWGRVRPRRSKIITATTLFIHGVLIIWLTLMYTAYMVFFGRRGAVAVVEGASVVGSERLAPDGCDPTRISTYGLGQVIEKAIKARGKGVVVALGDLASCDGGVGMASALGAQFIGHDGALIVRPTGADLRSITRIDVSGMDPAIRTAGKDGALVVACDVDHPLTGTNGAARVSGPELGATPEQVEDLDLGLETLARLCREAGLEADPDTPGAGAGGGVAFALATFCGAKLTPGVEALLEMVRLGNRLEKVDLVLTGGGPGSAAVAKMATERGTPVISPAERQGADGPECLEEATAEAVRKWLNQ